MDIIHNILRTIPQYNARQTVKGSTIASGSTIITIWLFIVVIMKIRYI